MVPETRTLIIDDDEVIVFLHDLIIKESGLDEAPVCFTAASPALNYLDEHQREDRRFLIFLDLNMNKMDGWQFLDALGHRPYLDRLFIVIVTSSIDYADHQRAGQYPHVIGYVEKPLTLEKCIQVRTEISGEV